MAAAATKLVIKLRAYDSHALKCAALAAAMKDDIVLDKVPLATQLKGIPLLTVKVRSLLVFPCELRQDPHALCSTNT